MSRLTDNLRCNVSCSGSASFALALSLETTSYKQLIFGNLATFRHSLIVAAYPNYPGGSEAGQIHCRSGCIPQLPN